MESLDEKGIMALESRLLAFELLLLSLEVGLGLKAEYFSSILGLQ